MTQQVLGFAILFGPFTTPPGRSCRRTHSFAARSGQLLPTRVADHRHVRNRTWPCSALSLVYARCLWPRPSHQRTRNCVRPTQGETNVQSKRPSNAPVSPSHESCFGVMLHVLDCVTCFASLLAFYALAAKSWSVGTN
jgi:hypothetical protein